MTGMPEPGLNRGEGVRTFSLLAVTEFYYPDPAVGQRMREILSALAADGHRILVLTSKNRYLKDGASDEAGGENGIRVLRLRSGFARKRSLLWQAAASWGFLAHAYARAALGREKFDILLTFSTPPMGHVVGNWLARFKGMKSVFWCADLHPESAIRLGLLRESSLGARVLRWVNTRALRRCDAIVAVGRCMKRLLEECGAPPERVSVIPMWHRDELAAPVDQREVDALRESLGISPEAFVVMYSGNLGRVHIVEDILRAAAALTQSNIVFLVSAAGVGAKTVQAFQQQHQLGNLIVRPLFPEEQLQTALAVADAHIITLRSELCGVSVPGKLYGVMAVGRPAVFVGPAASEAAMTIVEANCGIVVCPGQAGALSAALCRLDADRGLSRSLGERGRAAFLDRFSVTVCRRQWRDMLTTRFNLNGTFPCNKLRAQREPRSGVKKRNTPETQPVKRTPSPSTGYLP
jgi:colanic acid biosynthesis glycosyl transferase WcaI